MPTRYIGRQPLHKGKTLYEICRQLANAGEGRVVYRQRHADNWPEQKSFYRLTKVIPDKTSLECRKGQAWGHRVFRGGDYGEVPIGSGHKGDWRLVPKEIEEEFCRITEVHPIQEQPPSHVPAPPWLSMLLHKQQSKSVSAEGQLMIPLKYKPFKPRKDVEL